MGGLVRARSVVGGRLAAAALACVIAAGCAEDEARLKVVLAVVDDGARPEYALLSWTVADGRTLPDQRLPPSGAFAVSGSELGSVGVRVDRDTPGNRRVVVRGMRGDRVVSGAEAEIVWPFPDEPIVIILSAAAESPPPDAGPPVDAAPVSDAAAGPDTLPAPDAAMDTDPRHPDAGAPDAGAPDAAPPPPDAPPPADAPPRADAPLPADTAPLPPDAAPATPPDGPPAGPRPSLKLHWKFDEATGSKVLDWSGFGHDGTHEARTGAPSPSTNVPRLAAANPRSLAFSMAAFHGVELPGVPATLAHRTFTVSVWVRSRMTAADGSDVVSIGSNWRVTLTPGRLELTRHVGSGRFVTCGGSVPSILDGSWHFVAAVVGDTSTRLTAGTAQITCGGQSPIVYGLGDDLWVGRHGEGREERPFDGNVDELRIYDRQLTAAEVELLRRGADVR